MSRTSVFIGLLGCIVTGFGAVLFSSGRTASGGWFALAGVLLIALAVGLDTGSGGRGGDW